MHHQECDMQSTVKVAYPMFGGHEQRHASCHSPWRNG